MKKELFEELKSELLNKEISFAELDNYMMSKGFYSVFDDDVTGNIKADKNVVYTNTESNEAEIQIHFTITIDNEEDECEEAFILKVNQIEEF